MCSPKQPPPEIEAKARAILGAIDPERRAAIVETWRQQRLAQLRFDRLWAPIRPQTEDLGYDGFMVIYGTLQAEGYAAAEQS